MTRKQKKVLWRIIAAFLLLVIVSSLPTDRLPEAYILVLYLIPYLIIGYDILRKAVLGILHGKVFDENFLMAVATVGAMLLRDYREAVAVMLFYQIGELFQSVAVGKSRRNIAALMDIRPDYANVEDENGELEQVDPEDAKRNFDELLEVMNRIGYKCHYDTVEEIFEELRTVTPSYAGITYQRIEGKGIQWPCPSEDHPGTPILHAKGPIRNGGKGLLKCLSWQPSPDLGDPEYPMTLNTGRILYHYHTRTMTDRTRAIHFTAPRKWVEIWHEDAMEMGIAEGEWVKVSSRRGSVYAEARIVDTLQPGVAWMPFHYAEGANILSDAHHLDPVSKIPGYKQIGIKIEKADAETAAKLTAEAMAAERAYYVNEDPIRIRFKERAAEDLL